MIYDGEMDVLSKKNRVVYSALLSGRNPTSRIRSNFSFFLVFKKAAVRDFSHRNFVVRTIRNVYTLRPTNNSCTRSSRNKDGFVTVGRRRTNYRKEDSFSGIGGSNRRLHRRTGHFGFFCPTKRAIFYGTRSSSDDPVRID